MKYLSDIIYHIFILNIMGFQKGERKPLTTYQKTVLSNIYIYECKYFQCGFVIWFQDFLLVAHTWKRCKKAQQTTKQYFLETSVTPLQKNPQPKPIYKKNPQKTLKPKEFNNQPKN